MRWLARAGLVARGMMYVVIGWIAVEVAFNHSRQQADRTGALHAISATPVDSALRALAGTPLGPWLLVLVAIGLIMFGVFSCCEAKWMRL